MTDDTTDDLENLRRELGIKDDVKPEDFGLEFRSAESFFDEPAQPSVLTPRRDVRRWVPRALVAAAVLILASAVVVPRIGDSDDKVIAPQLQSVAQILDRAASASGTLPDTSDARFWRGESLQQQGTAPAETRTIWYGHRERGLVVDPYGSTPIPRATFSLAAGTVTWDELLALPTGTARLRDLLFRDAGALPDPGWRVAKAVAELLAESPAPPALRRALWQVLSEVPGAVSEGTATDALGRSGERLVFTAAGRGRMELLVDPAEGRLLESFVTPSRPGTDPYRATFVEQGPADRLP